MKKSKGFTLAELLIVVAIIAVLVAIAIPIFTSQLEKAREATDAANIRAAYAEAAAEAITADTSTVTSVTREVAIKQTTAGWVTTGLDIGGVTTLPDVKVGDKVVVEVFTDGTTATKITKK